MLYIFVYSLRATIVIFIVWLRGFFSPKVISEVKDLLTSDRRGGLIQLVE
jgi:hypothetical protein